MHYTLRPRQEAAKDSIKASIVDGNRAIMLQASTGFGKSIVACHLMESAANKGKRALFICDRITLVNQYAKHLYAAGLDFGVIQANHPMTDYSKPLQVASIQSLRKLENLPAFDFYIIDEAHCLHESHIKFMQKHQEKIWLGLSATPWAKGLGKYFSSLVIPATTTELINEGWLVKPRCFESSRPDLSGVKIKAGEFDEDGASKVMTETKLVGDVVANWLEHGEARPTIGFATCVKDAMGYAEEFKSAGIRASFISGYMDINESQEILDDFHSGRIEVLWTVDKLAKGYDYPGVSCMIYCQPTMSLMKHIQKIGRVLRICDGKQDALIFDHAGNLSRLGLPTDELQNHLDDGNKREAQKRKEPLPKACPKCKAMKPAKVGKCPECGFQPERKARETEHEAGELVETTSAKKEKKEKYTTAEKENIYAQLLGYAQSKGFKSGWAYHKTKEMTDTYPHRHVAPKEPGEMVLRWIRHLNIKHAKSKRKQQVAHA